MIFFIVIYFKLHLIIYPTVVKKKSLFIRSDTDVITKGNN